MPDDKALAAIWRPLDPAGGDDWLDSTFFDAPATPADPLAAVNAAGRAAAKAFAKALDAPLQKASDASRRRAAHAFLGVLVEAPGVPRATRRLATREMPRKFEALTAEAKCGRLGAALLREEVADRLGTDGGESLVDPRAHPLLAYADELGRDAAKQAFGAYRAALPASFGTAPPGYPSQPRENELRAATEKAQKAWQEALVAGGLGDLYDFVRGRLPDPAFWALVLSAAAGVAVSFVLGPRDVLGAADRVGLRSLSADLLAKQIGDRVKVKVGGKVAWLPEELDDGPLWGSALGSALGAIGEVEGRVSLGFEAFEVGTRVSYRPTDGSWGAKLTFTLAAF